MWTFFFPISMWWGVTYLHCIKDYLMIRFKYIYAFCTLEPHVKRGGFRNHGGKENSWSKIYIHIFLWIIYLGNQWISNEIYRKIYLRYVFLSTFDTISNCYDHTQYLVEFFPTLTHDNKVSSAIDEYYASKNQSVSTKCNEINA